MEIKKSTLYLALILVIVVSGGMFFVKGSDSTITGNVVSDGQVLGNVQKAVLSQDGYNYKDLKVKAGQPIELTADSSVGGCLRAPAFNLGGKRYTKYLQGSQDTLDLPALEKGEYNFACSMGMGFGKLIVE